MPKIKKKILLISHNFWPENFQINDVVEHLSDHYELSVLTGKPNYPKGKIFKNYNAFKFDVEKFKRKIDIMRVPIIPRGRGNSFMKVLNYFSFIFSSFIFLTFKSIKKYDLIFVYAPSPVIHSILGIYLKKLKKIPIILWLQDLWPVSIESSGKIKNKFILRIIGKIINFIYANVDVLLIQSKAYKKHLIGKIEPSKIFYIPNTCKEYFRNVRKTKNKELKIIYSGNIGLVQEFDTIIYAAKKIQKMGLNITFIFYGEGVKKQNFINKVEKNNLKNIMIMNYIKINRLIEKVYDSDVLFVSLKNFKELNLTIPSKIQFYMSMRKPILAEASGESAKIIKDSNSGLVSFPGDKNALLKNIIKFYKLKNKHKLNRLGLNGYKYFKNNFSLKIVTTKIRKCINQIEY